MRFLQTIIGRTNQPIQRAQFRRNPEDMSDRLRKSQSAETASSGPVFSRSANKIVRKAPTPIPPNASLNEILGHWKKEAQQENPEEYEAASTKPPEPAKVATVERVKTRLLGFDSVALPDTFEKTKPVTPTTKTRYPVGWLVVIDGAGRGESFTLLTGMSQIGRGSDQAVQLDFGDEAISRTNHAAIVYDVETHTFLMGHGGKSNVVRLNNKPLISTETLKSGDVIRIGQTSLQLMVFSTPENNWVEAPVLEAEDVAAS